MFIVTISIQGHTCDDLMGTRGGRYDVVMWESMEQKKLVATISMIILIGTLLKGRVDQTYIDLSLMVRI